MYSALLLDAVVVDAPSLTVEPDLALDPLCNTDKHITAILTIHSYDSLTLSYTYSY